MGAGGGAAPRDGAWQRLYAEAREALFRGDFSDAARRFSALVQSAETLTDKAVAFEMWRLAVRGQGERVLRGPPRA